MQPREPLLHDGLQSREGPWPEHDAPQDEERHSDRARQHDPADAGDDEQDGDLLGQGEDPADFFGVADRVNGALRLATTGTVTAIALGFVQPSLLARRQLRCHAMCFVVAAQGFSS